MDAIFDNKDKSNHDRDTLMSNYTNLTPPSTSITTIWRRVARL